MPERGGGGLGVGNGTMASSMMFFSAGATVYWGKSAENKDKKPKGKAGKAKAKKG